MTYIKLHIIRVFCCACFVHFCGFCAIAQVESNCSISSKQLKTLNYVDEHLTNISSTNTKTSNKAITKVINRLCDSEGAVLKKEVLTTQDSLFLMLLRYHGSQLYFGLDSTRKGVELLLQVRDMSSRNSLNEDIYQCCGSHCIDQNVIDSMLLAKHVTIRKSNLLEIKDRTPFNPNQLTFLQDSLDKRVDLLLNGEVVEEYKKILVSSRDFYKKRNSTSCLDSQKSALKAWAAFLGLSDADKRIVFSTSTYGKDDPIVYVKRANSRSMFDWVSEIKGRAILKIQKDSLLIN